MSMKKLLALLLALVLVFSLVACGGNSSSKSDDDKDDKGSSNVDKNNDKNDDKNDDKEDEKEPAKVSDAETVVGTWAYRAEISDAYLELMKTQTAVSTLSSDEDIYMDLAVEFKDEKLVIKGDMDEDSYTKFMIDMQIDVIYAMAAAQGNNKETFDPLFENQYGMTVAQYADNQVKLQIAQEGGVPKVTTDAKYYKVDETAGKIYLAETEEGLADTKEAIDYSIENGKLVLKKFYDDKGEETAAPLEMEEVGVNLPWTFEKK